MIDRLRIRGFTLLPYTKLPTWGIRTIARQLHGAFSTRFDDHGDFEEKPTDWVAEALPISVIRNTIMNEKPFIEIYDLNYEQSPWPAKQRQPASFADILDRIMSMSTTPAHRFKLIRHMAMRYIQKYDDAVAFVNSQQEIPHDLMESAERDELLRTFNAIKLRLSALSVPLNQPLVAFGICLASAAHSVQSLKQYVDLYDSGDQSNRGKLNGITLAIRTWVKHDHFTGWEGSRRKEGLLQILTGWKSGGIGKPGEIRQQSLFAIIHPDGTQLDPEYLMAVGKLSGGEAVFAEWERCRDTRRKLDSTDTGTLDGVVDTAVGVLLHISHPKMAWQVFQESGCNQDALSQDTWSQLLNYPQYLVQWQEGMAEHVLRKYEEYFQRIEGVLGIQWSGGEGGYHISHPETEMDDDIPS